MVKLTLSRKDPPIGSVLSCSVAGVPFSWCTETQLVLDDCVSLTTSQSISRHVSRINPALNLYPGHILHRTQVDHWLSISSTVGFGGSVKAVLPQLNNALATAHCLVPPHLTIADYELFAALYRSRDWQTATAEGVDVPEHVLRWYNFVLSQVSSILSKLPKDVKMACSAASGIPIVTAGSSRSSSAASSVASGSSSSVDKSKPSGSGVVKAVKREEGGKFVELPDAKMGEVVVRFPPEASGYLHIGHAKAALLNQHYQLAFKGKLVMRFDDTNPAKEDAHFEKVILDDLKLLHVKPDRFTHTSDYFDLMLQLCETLIKKGLAYVDNTDAETMKAERDERKDSKNRNNSVDTNMSMWDQMKVASPSGQKCAVRAKIDMNSNNGCMRDPTIYRCKPEPHIKTGTKYKVYPTYDFACPIVDSIEGVTHALRTTEYHDRDEQFFWFLEKLELRKLHVYEYSRLNMNNTVLSKRKLTWFVEQGLVDGWDDPRFPTVRGIIRRGMTVEGLKEFIISQGSSRSVVNMEWDKIWAFNKKVIDAIAPRYVALEKSSLIPINVSNATEKATTAQKHPKDPSIGTKTVWVGPKILIESVDAEELKEGQNATFINWGNLSIKKVNRENGKIVSVDAETNLTNADYKKTLKVTWLVDTAKAPLTPVVCVYFDHLINKGVLSKDEDFKAFIGHETRFETSMLGDDELKQLKVGDIIQIQRKGFFRVDEQYKQASLSTCKESPVVLFSVPDGHSKETAASAAGKKNAMSAKEVAQSAKGKKAEKSPQVEAKPIVGDKAKNIEDIHIKIKEQGDKIRNLKGSKADKNVVMSEVAILKDLKSNFSSISGVDWTPDINMSQFSASTSVKAESSAGGPAEIHQKIVDQGNVVRTLKENKAPKDEVTAAVNVLLGLKKEFKECSGFDWTPSVNASQFSKPNAPASNDASSIHQKIMDQGNSVRNLKGSKADKAKITEAVNVLLALKKEFRDASGLDWTPSIDVSQFGGPSKAPAVGTASAPAGQTVTSSNDSLAIHTKIVDQGSVVRTLKGRKAEKDDIKAAVDALLALKTEFKTASGLDWTPSIDVSQFGGPSKAPAVGTASAPAAHTVTSSNDSLAIHTKIVDQGSVVRTLKGRKADKDDIKAAVDALLALKTEFKTASGLDWTPSIDVSQFSKAKSAVSVESSTVVPASSDNKALSLHDKIVAQGNTVRTLKGSKADKADVTAAVNVLLSLKKEFKNVTNIDWTPTIDVNQFGESQKSSSPALAATPPAVAAAIPTANTSADTGPLTIHQKIVDQGNCVRNLKSSKADKAEVLAAVNTLLALKKDFKESTGIDWAPNIDTTQFSKKSVTESSPPSNFEALNTKVKVQGDKIRQLKSSNADKVSIKAEVDILLKYKEEFKNAIGIDWKPDMNASQLKAQQNGTSQPRASSKPNEVKKTAVKKEEKQDVGKKQTRLGLEVMKEENLSDWYSQVITKSEMIEYYNVSGCYILRPWSYSIWDYIKTYMDAEIKKLGVENSYFPIFVAREALEKEKDHIADFSPEVAWVTKSGSSDMAEPVAIRPTSETAMYPSFAKWIQSHRDLPLRLNQWNNVVRWEFKQPTPFLRTREFLWQEGHTAFETKAEATAEVYQVLDLYASVYEDLLAIPVVKGKKTEKEKFAGGDFTTTTEAFISASGRGIQGATSHHLGQNFSKMFDIVYEDPTTREKKFVYQNSWGLTTRSIGVMVMVHGDNKGLVLPPRVASIQAVIMPVGITAKVTENDKKSLYDACDKLEKELIAGGVRTRVDLRDNVTPAWKFNHWELKGVPLRLELGPREVASGEIFVVRRDTGEKQAMTRSSIVSAISTLLSVIHTSMLDRARQDLEAHKKLVSSWPEFVQTLDEGKIMLAAFCGQEPCEEMIKKESARDQDAEPGAPSMGAKSLCIPFQQPQSMPSGTLCIHPNCRRRAQYYCLFGRSY